MTARDMAERWLVAGCAAALAAGAAWAIGFSAFNHAARRAAEPQPAADGIVVLTGGAERVEAGLRLLAEERAPMLLVSGVGHGAELGALVRRAPVPPEQVSRVTLGRMATTTAGNAQEARAWAQANRMQSLLVVTAGYHMPRALLEIGQAAPGITLYPAPVQSPALRGETDFATLRMLAGEFDKYLAVWLGLVKAERL